MAKQVINIGTTPDDGTGDPGRDAFDKVNDNFTELYTDKADSVDVLLLDGTQSMDANKSITFTSDGFDIGPSSTDGAGFPSIETSYCEIHYGYAGSGNDVLSLNYYKGSGVDFGEGGNRQDVNFYLHDTIGTGVTFDFGTGIQMQYSVLTVGADKYMRFGTTGLKGLDFNDNAVLAFGTGADATIAYDTNNLVINPKSVGTGYLDVQGDIHAAGLTSSALTAGRIAFSGASGLLSDDAGLLYDAANNQLTIQQTVDNNTQGIELLANAGNYLRFFFGGGNNPRISSNGSIVFDASIVFADNDRFNFGASNDYYFSYRSGTTDFALVSSDVDGIGTNANVFSVQDGTDDVLFNGELTASKFNMASMQTYTPTNVTPDRSYNADSTTLDEVADVLGTLIADLQTAGLID